MAIFWEICDLLEAEIYGSTHWSEICPSSSEILWYRYPLSVQTLVYLYVHTKKPGSSGCSLPELMENHSLKWFWPIPIFPVIHSNSWVPSISSDIKDIHYSNPLFFLYPTIFPRFLVEQEPQPQLAKPGSERRSPVFGALQMVQVPVTGVDQLRGEAHLFEHAINVGGPHVIRLSLQKKGQKCMMGNWGKGEEKGGKGNALQEICHVHIIRISYLCIVASN